MEQKNTKNPKTVCYNNNSHTPINININKKNKLNKGKTEIDLQKYKYIKKIDNVKDFISQGGDCLKLSSKFDHNGTKEFLSCKSKALEKINVFDELDEMCSEFDEDQKVEEKNKKICRDDKNLSKFKSGQIQQNLILRNEYIKKEDEDDKKNKKNKKNKSNKTMGKVEKPKKKYISCEFEEELRDLIIKYCKPKRNDSNIKENKENKKSMNNINKQHEKIESFDNTLISNVNSIDKTIISKDSTIKNILRLMK